MEQTIYIKMRNRLKVSPTYEVKLRDVAQLAGDTVVVESLQDEVVYKITAHDKTHVVIDVMKIIEIIQQKAAHIQINLLGSGQTLVEIIYEKRKYIRFSSDLYGCYFLLERLLRSFISMKM